MKRIVVLFFILTTMSFAEYSKTWDEILSKYTKEGEKEGISLVLVDYNGIKNSQEFPKLLEEVKNIDLSKMDENSKKAFWINAYNIGAVKMVIDNLPMDSIKDAGSIFKPVWDKSILAVGNRVYTLGRIEHTILKRMNDEMIHFGIVCASISCPDLRMESYKGERVEEQLREQKMKFLNNPEKGIRQDKNSNTIHISRIFKWFREDFEDNSEYQGMIKGKKIRYLKYNWNLNSAN